MAEKKPGIPIEDLLNILCRHINGTFTEIHIKEEGTNNVYTAEFVMDPMKSVREALGGRDLATVHVHDLTIEPFTNYLCLTINRACSFFTIHDWSDRNLYMADLLKYVDGKTDFHIYENARDPDGNPTGDDVELYHGRAEYLQWTEDREMHKLALRKIADIDAGKDRDGSPIITVRLEDEV